MTSARGLAKSCSCCGTFDKPYVRFRGSDCHFNRQKGYQHRSKRDLAGTFALVPCLLILPIARLQSLMAKPLKSYR